MVLVGVIGRKTIIRVWAKIVAWSHRNGLRLIARKTTLLVLFPIVALVASTIILSPLLFPPGLPFQGDETWYIPWTLTTLSRFNLQMWLSGNGPSADILTLFITSILVGLSTVLGQEFGVKGYLLLMAWLSAVIPYVATKQLLRHWRLILQPLQLEIASGVSGMVYLLYFYNQATVAGSNNFVWDYSLFPLLVSSLVLFLDTGKMRRLLTFGVFSVLASPQPFWPYLVGIVGLIYFIFALLRRPRIPGPLKLIRNSFLAIATALGFNALWIVPTIAGYFFQVGGSAFQIYGGTGAVSLGDLSFLSFWSLQDILLMGESAHYFFWNHPQTYTLFSLVIPVLAVASVLVYRRNRAVFFLAAVLTVGALATAGVNEPIGFLYYLITTHLPNGAGAILRNPTKFASLVTFAYGPLLGLGVVGLGSILSSRRIPLQVFRRNLVRYSIVIILIFLILTPIAYGTLLDLQGYTYPRYSPTNIPEQYGDLNNWLGAQAGGYKVMWIPSGGAYDWKQQVITGFPDLLSSQPTVPFTNIYPNPLSSTNNIGRYLAFMGVKYVVYHSDSINYPNEQILQELLSQQDLTPVDSFNGTIAPIDDSLAPLPIGVDIGPPGTSFGNSPFHLSTLTLPRGQDNLTLSYTIPQSVVAQGYQGQFADWFGILVHGFPAGSVDFSNRVFVAPIASQHMINQTNGSVSFNITASFSYPDTSIDLYANFYDSGFRPISPVYFVERLTLVPRQIINRYIIFENRDFAGPVFSQNANIVSANVTDLLGSNASIVSLPSANVTSYQQMSEVEFRVTADASSPFILVLTEPFDGLWRAYVGNAEIRPTQIYGLVNGFWVYQTGPLNIRIYYTAQNYLYLGIGLSATSFSVSILAVALSWRKDRRKIPRSQSIIMPVPIPAKEMDQPIANESLQSANQP